MRRAALVIGLSLIAAGIAVVAYAMLGGEDNRAHAPVTALPAAALDVADVAESPEPSPTLSPAETPNPSAVVRFEMPTLGVNARVVTLGVLPDGTMEAPHTPTDVAWYHFSAKPGASGNAVFAAHVDYIRYGPAVFYRLRELKEGDPVTATLEDGSRFTYLVVSSVIYDAETAPVQEIVGPARGRTMTLITCTGVFDRNVLQYDKRLVVRAELAATAVR
jgi:LPXTG-site transpeptidase (sortase) family protein